jgi:hypothetical protein
MLVLNTAQMWRLNWSDVRPTWKSTVPLRFPKAAFASVCWHRSRRDHGNGQRAAFRHRIVAGQ